MCKEPRKESPCGLSIAATDFYVYVRDKYFCVYVHGRKDGRKAGDNFCELPNIDTDFCWYVRDKDYCAYVKGRR